MKVFNTIIFSILCSFITDVIAQEHEHHGQAHDVQMSLDNGKKWQIDDSLHIGLNRLKTVIESNIDAIHYDQFTKAQYAKLAIALDQHLTFLFENCKLPAKADAQLHILLSQIISGTSKIKLAKNKKSGVVVIIQALNNYPVYFQDPKWQPIKH